MKVYCWSGLNYKRAIVKRSTRREGRMSICNKGRLFGAMCTEKERAEKAKRERKKERNIADGLFQHHHRLVGKKKRKKKKIYLLPLVGRGSNLHLGARGGAVDAAVSGLEFEFRTVRDSVAVRLSLVALSIELFLSRVLFLPQCLCYYFAGKTLSVWDTSFFLLVVTTPELLLTKSTNGSFWLLLVKFSFVLFSLSFLLATRVCFQCVQSSVCRHGGFQWWSWTVIPTSSWTSNQLKKRERELNGIVADWIRQNKKYRV